MSERPKTDERPEARDDRAVRTALTLGPILTCVGIAWTAVAPSTLANAAVLTGFVTCVWGTHRYGRQGADAGARSEAAEGDPRATP